jgi:hypothetical protein
MDMLRKPESHNSNLKLNPLDDFQRVKNSFETVLCGYVTSATLAHIGADTVNDADGFIPVYIKTAPKFQQCRWLLETLRPAVEKYCKLGCTNIHSGLQRIIREQKPTFICRYQDCGKQYMYVKSRNKHEQKKHDLTLEEHHREEAEVEVCGEEGDGVYNYGCNVITLGMMVLSSDDAVSEGDGARIVEMYKWWLLIWRRQESTKYSLAGLLLEIQFKCVLSEQKAHRLIWNLDTVLVWIFIWKIW